MSYVVLDLGDGRLVGGGEPAMAGRYTTYRDANHSIWEMAREAGLPMNGRVKSQKRFGVWSLRPHPVHIELHRVEGGEKRDRCRTILEASIILSRWASSAPADGSYDKTDFTILFNDGSTYSGRIDLQKPMSLSHNLLRSHIMSLQSHIADHPDLYSVQEARTARAFLEGVDLESCNDDWKEWWAARNIDPGELILDLCRGDASPEVRPTPAADGAPSPG